MVNLSHRWKREPGRVFCTRCGEMREYTTDLGTYWPEYIPPCKKERKRGKAKA